MITKDGRDTRLENVTAENYIVPAGEERFYHVVIEVPQYDRRTGKKQSRPRLQKFGPKAFDAYILDSLRKQGYEINILHDPTVAMAQMRSKVAAAMKAEAEAKAAAESELAATNAALKAELDALKEKLAAMKAETEKKAEAKKPAEKKGK